MFLIVNYLTAEMLVATAAFGELEAFVDLLARWLLKERKIDVITKVKLTQLFTLHAIELVIVMP